MIDQLVALVILAAAGLAGLRILDALILRPALMAAIMVPALLIDSVAKLPPAVIGPFNVFLTDVLVSLAIAATAARLLRLTGLSVTHRLMLLLLGFGFFSLARGIAEFGPKTPVVSARGTVFFLAVAFYFSTFSPTEDFLDSVRRYWLYGALGLTAVAMIRWGAAAAGLGGIELLNPGAGADRVLDSNQALFIAQGFLIALPGIKAAQGNRVIMWITGWLLAVTVLLEHRSVWVVVIASLVVFAVRDRELSRRLIVLMVAAGAVGSLLILTVFSGTEGDAATSLSDSATDTGTWEWRVEGWKLLLADAREFETFETIVGEPLGKPFERQINTRTVSSQPHNYYVQVLLRLGAAGVVLLVVTYIAVIIRLHRAARTAVRAPLSTNVLIALMVSQLVYFVTYAPETEQGILLGTALAVGAWRRPDAPKRESAVDETQLVVLNSDAPREIA